MKKLPSGFIYLSEIAPEIRQYMMYATSDNFTGRRVDGYNRGVAICTEESGIELKSVASELSTLGLGLKVYDFYRPHRACQDFVEWSLDISDQSMKEKFFPNVEKKDFFDLGYLAKYSTHSRGSTVDLTIIDISTEKELDMGTIVDFLDELSHTENRSIPKHAQENRMLLKSVMEKHSFEGYSKEWWHFRYKNEPFSKKPQDHFDFIVE